MQNGAHSRGHDFKRGGIRAAHQKGRPHPRTVRDPGLRFRARPDRIRHGAAQDGRVAHPVRVAQCPTRARCGSGARGAQRRPSCKRGRKRLVRPDLELGGRVVGFWCTFTATPTIGRSREDAASCCSKHRFLHFTKMLLIKSCKSPSPSRTCRLAGILLSSKMGLRNFLSHRAGTNRSRATQRKPCVRGLTFLE